MSTNNLITIIVVVIIVIVVLALLGHTRVLGRVRCLTAVEVAV